MQNLSIDNKKEDCKKNDKNAEESGITMDFSHFTFAETTEPQEDEVQPAKKQSSPKVTTNHGHSHALEIIQTERKVESEDPLYANIEPSTTSVKRNSMRNAIISFQCG